MHDIKIPVPIIPLPAIKDMDDVEQYCAALLLTHNTFNDFQADEKLLFTLFSPFNRDSQVDKYPDEIIAEYREKEKYPSVSITAIPVDEIYESIADLSDLSILFGIIHAISLRVGRLSKLIELDAPDIVIRNEIRMLRKKIELLLNGSKEDPLSVSLRDFRLTIVGDRLLKIPSQPKTTA